MDEDNLTLDQLIKLVNRSKNRLTSLSSQPSTKKLPPLSSSHGYESTSIKNVHTLSFKPWSGIIDMQGSQGVQNKLELIKQEEENDEGEKEDFIDGGSSLFQQPSSSQLGYFYKFQNGKVRLIKYLLDENGFKDGQNNKNWTLCWASSSIKQQFYKDLLPYQKVNHFPNSFHLTRKDLMNKAISKMQAKYGINHYNFVPKTYILPQQINLFMNQGEKAISTYIVKPHNKSQGKGIIVTNSISTIISKVEKYTSVIVSQYIENPLLINRLKFDLRIYVAITGINPLRIYVYEEGLARFATQQYDTFDCENKRFQHLTNYSVNKKNSDFIPSTNEQYFGSKWSLTSLKDFLTFNIGRMETNQLFQKIDDLIVKTILSVENILFTSFFANVPYINSCFEVFGFDVLIDSNLKPWLIEVNLSPSMNTDSPMDLKIKGNMIADLFTLIGITSLSQRYLDGGHSRYEAKHYLKSEDIRRQDSLIDKFIIKQLQAEDARSGQWRRVFPTKSTKYKNFFEVDRYFNRLIREHFRETTKYTTSTYHSVQQKSNGKKSQKVSIRASRLKKTKKHLNDNFAF